MRPATRTAAAAACVAAAMTASALQAGAEDRSQLVACQALVDRAAQTTKNNVATAGLNEFELTRCRQIVREWMLRDARMSVDERGKPIR